MEEHNSLLVSPLAINWIANNASGFLDTNLHCAVNPQSNGILLEPLQVPQWMHCQTMPQNYVEFLAEKGCPEIQKQMSYDVSAQKQIWNEECSHAFDTYPGSSSAASKYPSEARRNISKQKAYATARCRRLRISYWLDALHELMPHSKLADKAALLDNVMDYIKVLQNQMKDLCGSKLGGESTSDSVSTPEEQTLSDPLEEMMGQLIDVYPSAATELLHNRGLVVMPMTFAEGLFEEMLDVQEKGTLMISK